MASIRFRMRQAYWRWTAPGKMHDYLRRQPPHKLQIGAGANLLPGWLNTTLYPFAPGAVFLDACLPFALADESFDYVFSEHVIEHLEFEQAAHMLRESWRILRKGGRIRIATPDLERIIALYTQPDGEAQRAYSRWIIESFCPTAGDDQRAHVINQSFHGWLHKFIYNEPTLVDALKEAGFSNVERVEPGHSEDENLRGIEQHGATVGNEEAMRYETMVLEAQKPRNS